MGVVIIKGKLTKELIKEAMVDLGSYIKITIDIEQEIVAIGGQYHHDAEQILIRKFGSKNSNIWGGGYDIELRSFETNALINLKPILSNNDTNIKDDGIKQRFLEIVEKKLSNLESLL